MWKARPGEALDVWFVCPSRLMDLYDSFQHPIYTTTLRGRNLPDGEDYMVHCCQNDFQIFWTISPVVLCDYHKDRRVEKSTLHVCAGSNQHVLFHKTVWQIIANVLML